MSLQDDLVKRASVLRNVRFGEVSGRLARLLDWMEQQPPIAEVINRLRRTVDGISLILKADVNQPPPADTPEEIAAVGLVLMEACRNEDFAGVCLSRGIGPPFNTNAVQPYVDAGLDGYVVPFLAHVENELSQSICNQMPANIVERGFGELVLGPKFSAKFPITHRHLSRIATEFVRPETETAWQNIGNSCRQAMQEFCNECAGLASNNVGEQTKRGDVKAISRELIRSKLGNGRAATALETLIASIWDYAQSLTHRANATRDEALRVYLWTGLAINELAELFLCPQAEKRDDGL